jgi:hypothetical protein
MAGPYYVDGAVGNDGNAGTSEGAGNAWATIDKAMNTIAAGEKCWVKASATYTETAHVDTAGGIATWITFEGYTATPGDGGQATIDGESTRATGLDEGGVLSSIYYIFKNFRFTGHTGDGVDVNSMFYIMFVNCRFDNNSTGCDPGNNIGFIDCQFDTNSVDGCEESTDAKYVGCLAYNNTDIGIELGAGGAATYCVFYGNGSSATVEGGLRIGSWGQVSHCTFDGDNSATKLGIYSTAWNWVVFNNIFYDCHIGFRGTNSGYEGYNDFNSYIDCTTDVSNVTAGSNSLTGQSGDPFTDSAGRDYTLASTSEGESDVGRDYNDATSGADMGAQQLSQAGGGGTVSHVGGNLAK